MRTRNFTSAGTIFEVQSVTRRTVITEAGFRKALLEKYPLMNAAFLAAGDVPSPVTNNADDIQRYEMAMSVVRRTHEEGYLMLGPMFEYVGLAARLVREASPTPDSLQAEFENYLNDEPDGFWEAMVEAIVALDNPVVPEHEQPLVALEEQPGPEAPGVVELSSAL